MAATPLIQNKVLIPKEFNRVSSSYDLATSLSQGYQDDLNLSAKRMQLRGNEKLLDLCCGTGKSTLACLQQLPQGSVVGVDNSEGMLGEANNKFAEQVMAGKVKFILNDAMHLTFADAAFDAVFMAYGLRNMPDYTGALQGIARVLKPGGKLCIHDYSLTYGFFARAYWAVLGYGFIVPFCTLLSGSSRIYTYLIKSVLRFLHPSQIKTLLEANDFEQVTIEPLPGWRKPILHTITAVRKAG